MVRRQRPVETGRLGAEIDAESFPRCAAFRAGLAGSAKEEQDEYEQSPIAQGFAPWTEPEQLAYKEIYKY
jgi:hypothetical protein